MNKIKFSDIKNYFPVRVPYPYTRGTPDIVIYVKDYDGEPGEAQAGREYFKKRFARLAQKANQKEREIYIQYVLFPHRGGVLLALCSILTVRIKHHDRYRYQHVASSHGCS